MNGYELMECGSEYIQDGNRSFQFSGLLLCSKCRELSINMIDIDFGSEPFSRKNKAISS